MIFVIFSTKLAVLNVSTVFFSILNIDYKAFMYELCINDVEDFTYLIQYTSFPASFYALGNEVYLYNPLFIIFLTVCFATG